MQERASHVEAGRLPPCERSAGDVENSLVRGPRGCACLWVSAERRWPTAPMRLIARPADSWTADQTYAAWRDAVLV